MKLIQRGTLKRWGESSLALIIPSDLVKALFLEVGQDVYLEVEEGGDNIKVKLKRDGKNENS